MSDRNPASLSREDRLAELEKRVVRLEQALLARAEPVSPPEVVRAEAVTVEPVAKAEAIAEPEEGRSEAASLILDILAQTGWSVLTLAGAFLIRALTDRGAMATSPGVAFGLAYAFFVLVLADRAVRRGNRLTAAFLGSTGLFIANAIVAETTTRFAIFSPGAGLSVLAFATAMGLGLGRRDDLPVVAWTATLAACATSVFLAVATHEPALSGLVLLLLATAAFWLSTERWPWRLLAWPPTLCAVGLSLWATSTALGPKPPEGALGVAVVLALGLPLLWPGSVLVKALLGRPNVGGLAIVQMVLSLSVGLVGALQLARASGPEAPALAAIAIACGVAAYGRAFVRERLPEERPSRLYFSWFGLALVLIGSVALFPAPVPGLLWSALALGAIVWARVYEPSILQPQGAVYVAAAAVASGLLSISTAAFTAPDADVVAMIWPALAGLAIISAATAVLFLEKPAAGQMPGFVAAFFAALGLGALAVLLLRHPAEGVLKGSLPALRTVILSVSAYVLARLWRSTGRKELRTLTYLALVAGGLKLLVEDLPKGTPLTLFVAFVFYGGALLLIPRLMRAKKLSPAHQVEREPSG